MAGCAIAVFVLAVCTRPWSEETSLIENLTGRLYVDDSTTWSTGTVEQVEEALAGGVAATRAFEKAMCWNLHPDKSIIATSRKQLTRTLAEITGLTGADQVKYLGIIHQPGTKAKKRHRNTALQKAAVRWNRIGRLVCPKI